jgi:hypothetical protein
MNFKRYLNKIQGKNKKLETEIKKDVFDETKTEVKNIQSFVDPNKDPREYLKRYLKEQKYKEWFNRNYPNFTIYDAVGLSASDYLEMKRQLFPESEPSTKKNQPSQKNTQSENQEFKPTLKQEPKTNFDEFIDERLLVSHNTFGNKEMKIKIIEISDENPPLVTKFGNRIKINKILITIKHLDTQEIEEGEFDIEKIENELIEKRHYASGNRWVPTKDIRNGYVTNTRHTSLTCDAAALDYIIF